MAEKKTAKAAKTGKTVTVRQIRSANRKPDIQAQTLRGLGPGQDPPHPHPGRYARRCAA